MFGKGADLAAHFQKIPSKEQLQDLLLVYENILILKNFVFVHNFFKIRPNIIKTVLISCFIRFN